MQVQYPNSSQSSMIKALARFLLRSSVLRGSAAAFAIKLAASIAGFTMFALSSRYMDPASFGSLAIVLNAMSFLSVVALCGQETLIVRSWNEYRADNRPELARGALLFGMKVAAAATLLIAVTVAVAWPAWDRAVPTALVLASCAFLVAYAFMQFSGQFTRVAAGVIIGEIPRELTWRLLVVITIATCHALRVAFDATAFFFT